jgi:hypothetical protein
MVMMTPPPRVGMPAMPSIAIPPALSFGRLRHSGGPEQKGRERRDNDFPHRYTS